VRLAVLDSGHTLGTKFLFAVIRFFSRQPTPEPLKLVTYRPDFYGTFMKRVTQEAMRGPSAWSVGERELMAAVVSKANACDYCIRAHTAISTLALGDSKQVSAAVDNVDTAPLTEPPRATLRFLQKLARERTVNADDVSAVLAAGASRAQVMDALAVAFAFGVTNRLADTFEFAIPGADAFEAGAKFLLARGYK
jgi:uncharacterized peroxidase-related enzyme